MTSGPVPFEVFRPGIYLHGTKAVLVPGEVLEPGRASNFEDGRISNHIYIVEPIGEIEDDPNLTNTRFVGNPTRSYRTRYALRMVDEVLEWEGHPPDVLKTMRDHLAELRRQGIEAIND